MQYKNDLIMINRTKTLISCAERSFIRDTNMVFVPILGMANCGQPLAIAQEFIEGFLEVSESLLNKKEDLFCIRAIGDSMNNADINGNSIEEGDYVIVDGTNHTAHSGDYILSIINGMATIKLFDYDKKNKQIILISQSTTDYPPIYIHPKDFTDYMVNGKIVQVIKNNNNKTTRFDRNLNKKFEAQKHDDKYFGKGKYNFIVQRQLLEQKYKHKIQVNEFLGRSLVSYQANKKLPFYRWFKFKEGFSLPMIKHFINYSFPNKTGRLLDPFAGSGAALFAARQMQWHSIGIELLPVGANIISSRIIAEKCDTAKLTKLLNKLSKTTFENIKINNKIQFKHIKITDGAFPDNTENQLNGFLTYCEKNIKSPILKRIVLFAAFCTLESISYTRKDGQYLRWDHRATMRQIKTKFNKGKIAPFNDALCSKLQEILDDINNSRKNCQPDNLPDIDLKRGDVLSIMPTLQAKSIDMIITSPPYCNRYDYTRTYALELAYLGYDNEAVKQLRQEMLSCTVENRDKLNYLQQIYKSEKRADDFNTITSVFEKQMALQEILRILNIYKLEKKLNNPNIVRMIKNYFYEMAFVIFEMYRVLKKNGIVYMVNDNVRYAGETIPVDLILSDFAEKAGFQVETIWKLKSGKGNSSQQMGVHGREELRKCVYVWKK